MKQRHFLSVFFISLLVVALFLQHFLITKNQSKDEPLEIFVGIDVAYENLTETKQCVDKISNYTNIIILGCTGTTYNFTKLNEICQYVYDRGFSFIIYSEMPPEGEWFLCSHIDCITQYGDKFLGVYAFDEGGGRQLDLVKPRPFSVDEAENRTDAREKFVTNATERLNWFTGGYNSSIYFPLFTSDYALYWFDYKAGYDVVFAEFGWNYSRELNVALCRGAATVQNKNWGVMITWTYNESPYMESGEKLYEDMLLAYENGAKYIIVFDTNKEYTQGILQDEHLDALEQFWQYAQNNPRISDPPSSRVAYVLLKDCGYGFRGPSDKIWGLWEADEFTCGLCTTMGQLLEQYKSKFDIIYDDELNSTNTAMYSMLIYWNGTICTR
jgi:hypothetical protein